MGWGFFWGVWSRPAADWKFLPHLRWFGKSFIVFQVFVNTLGNQSSHFWVIQVWMVHHSPLWICNHCDTMDHCGYFLAGNLQVYNYSGQPHVDFFKSIKTLGWLKQIINSLNLRVLVCSHLSPSIATQRFSQQAEGEQVAPLDGATTKVTTTIGREAHWGIRGSLGA